MDETSQERRRSRKQYETGKRRSTRKNGRDITRDRGEKLSTRSRSPSNHRRGNKDRKLDERRRQSFSSSGNRGRRRTRERNYNNEREFSSDDEYRARKRRRSKDRCMDNRLRRQDESPSRTRKHRPANRHSRRERRSSKSSESDSSAEGPRNVVVSYSDDNSDEEDYTWNDTPRECKRAKSRPSQRPGSKEQHDDTVGHYSGSCGSVVVDRYKILREVGLGTFGRVVECLDLNRRQGDGKDAFVALKIVRNIKRYHDSALIEARIVGAVNRRGGRGRSHFVELFDSFSFQGHFCMVFESLGPSLYDFMKRHDYQPFPMACVQDFTVQLLEALEFLHSFRLIHTDLKIENILLMNDREVTFYNQRVPESTKIKIIDFGGSCYDHEKKSSVINTRQYRAPEVILGTGWNMASDMWSLGCILAELYRGELLFATHDNLEHLALMERVVGRFPTRLLRVAREGRQKDLAKDAFDSSGRHRLDRILPSESAIYVRNALALDELVRNREDLWFLDLLRKIIVIDPTDRATAHECLQFLSRIRRYVVRHN